MRAALVAASFVSLALVGAPTRARAEPPIHGQRMNDTAYTLRGREFSLGVVSEQFGILDELTIGTYLVPWFAFPLLKSPIPSLFVKARDWYFSRVAVSARAGVVWFNADSLSSDLTGKPASSGLAVVPLDLTASAQLHPSFTQSLGFTYVAVGADLDARSGTAIGGAAATDSLTVHALSELRLSRVVALTLLAKGRILQSDLRVTTDVDRPGLSAHADLGVVAERKFLWCVVPGVSFRWPHVGLELGLGYGSNWIPFIELPVDFQTLVPQGDFYFRF